MHNRHRPPREETSYTCSESCPEPPPQEFTCGEYRCCGRVELHYTIPEGGRCDVYRGDDDCWIGDLSDTGCNNTFDLTDEDNHVVRWCVPEGSSPPSFRVSPLNGYAPYYKLSKGDAYPEFECFNSFTVCIPSCCSIKVKVDDMPSITLSPMDEAYCRGFGPFDKVLNDLTLHGTDECIEETTVAVQRSKYGQPPMITVSPKLPSTPCGGVSFDEGDFETVCFRRNANSPIESGYMVFTKNSSGISKVLYDNSNAVVISYSIAECC